MRLKRKRGLTVSSAAPPPRTGASVQQAGGPTPRTGVPILVALVENNGVTTGAQLGSAGHKPGPHANGTLCVVRPHRTLWFWNGGPSGVWDRCAI